MLRNDIFLQKSIDSNEKHDKIWVRILLVAPVIGSGRRGEAGIRRRTGLECGELGAMKAEGVFTFKHTYKGILV